MQNQSDIISGSVFDAASSTQKNQLGREVRVGSRVFVYVSSAVDIPAGAMCIAPAATAVTANKLTAAAIGAKEITLELAGVTANQFADGYLHLTDDTGQAYTYGIKSNTASAATTNLVTIVLYDELLVAIDATTDCVLTANPYGKVLLGTASAANKAIGAAVRASTAATAGVTQYFWVQKSGPASVLLANATSVAAGVNMILSGTAGGIAADADAGTTLGTEVVAIAISAAEDANGFQPVWLTC